MFISDDGSVLLFHKTVRQALRAGIQALLPSTLPVEMTVQMSGETPLAVIRALQQNPELTIPMLATQLGLSSRTIERHLQKLQQQGVVKRIGSTKGGYWQVVRIEENK